MPAQVRPTHGVSAPPTPHRRVDEGDPDRIRERPHLEDFDARDVPGLPATNARGDVAIAYSWGGGIYPVPATRSYCLSWEAGAAGARLDYRYTVHPATP